MGNPNPATAIMLVAGLIGGIFLGAYYKIGATEYERKAIRIFLYVAIAMALVITVVQKWR